MSAVLIFILGRVQADWPWWAGEWKLVQCL